MPDETHMTFAVPTYHPSGDYGPEIYVPVVVYDDVGVRVVLGTHDPKDHDKPDVQIERRKNGWAIFLHPLGGSDPCACVYFHDDGRSWIVKVTTHGAGPTPDIEEADDVPKEIDR